MFIFVAPATQYNLGQRSGERGCTVSRIEVSRFQVETTCRKLKAYEWLMEIKDRLFVGRKKNDVDEKYDLRHRLKSFNAVTP